MCLFSPFPRLRLIFLFIIFAVPSLRPLSINTLPPRSLSSTTMSIAAVRLHAHIERGFAHFHGRRSPLEGVSSTTAPTPSTSTAPMEVIKLPTSVKALSGIIVVLGLCLLSVTFWKIRAWRRRREGTTSNMTPENAKQTGLGTGDDLEAFAGTEKPMRSLFLHPIPPPASSGVGWKPQIRSEIAIPQPTKPRSEHAKKAWEKNFAEFIAPTNSSHPPPPSYFVSLNSLPREIPPLPPMPSSPPRQALPPTPPAALKLNFGAIEPPPTQKPMTSPIRTSRYVPNPIAALRLSSSSRKSNKKLPRLMNVSNTFDPSMDDELDISVGETVRLLEEYEDDWCLVQRVGRIDAAKGMVPRFCLSERPEVVPQHPGLPSAAYRR